MHYFITSNENQNNTIDYTIESYNIDDIRSTVKNKYGSSVLNNSSDDHIIELFENTLSSTLSTIYCGESLDDAEDTIKQMTLVFVEGDNGFKNFDGREIIADVKSENDMVELADGTWLNDLLDGRFKTDDGQSYAEVFEIDSSFDINDPAEYQGEMKSVGFVKL